MRLIAIFLIFFVATIFCQTTLVQWGALVNTTSPTGQFRNRVIRAKLLDGAVLKGGLLKSIERTLVNGQVDKNGIRFAGYAINPNLLSSGVAPTAVSAYFSKESDVLNNTADGNGVTFEVNKASNFIAVRFFSLEEVDTNGNVVNTLIFRGQTWSIVNSTVTTSEQVDVRLPYLTLGATIAVNGNNVPVQLTFIATADLATITIPGLSGGPIVPPKGLEIIFAADLTNYPYASATNYLRLVTFTASGSASRSTNVTSPNPAFDGRPHTFVTSVVNDIPISVRFDQRASLSGSRSFGVNPSNTVSTSYSAVFNGTDTNLQIDSFFGANVQLTRTDVPFPPNAKELVIYDPTVSVGTDPTTTSSVNFGSVVSVSAALLILCILAQFF